ncbi:MAG: GNAT family N-acetyltransferase [Bdellovibrionales bacterium]|nr:GNAT family N-acetyltransferase [Bdellovibrionales bacterium]
MTKASSVSFKVVSSLDELSMVFFVRGCVFVEEMQFAYEDEFDGTDASATHLLALNGREPIGAARVRYLDGAARIERICIREAYRGSGLGDRLLAYTLSSIDQSGYLRSSVFADGRLVGWYRNHGFEIEREATYPSGETGYELLRVLGEKKSQPKAPARSDSIFSAKTVQPDTAAEGRKVCAISGQKFEVTDADREYYVKVGVPEPTLCPEERARRRMAFANQRNLFPRECAATGKRIVTNVPPESKVPVYDIMYWWSDKWDRFATGRDFEFTRPFFEQFRDLMQAAPRPNLQRAAQLDENSDYTNYAGENKNCYLIFDSDKNRDCYYSYSINSCVDVVDCFRAEKCELCYECIDCTNCYGSVGLQNCDNCSSSYFLKNCIGCSDCFGCVNLRNKQYHILNEKYSKEEYFKRIKSLALNTAAGLKGIRPEFVQFSSKFPQKNFQGVQNENIIGDYLTNCKNAFYCFDSRNLWDCKYILQAFDDAKDCMDCTEVGYGAELLYECCYVGYTAHSNRFCTHALGNNNNLTYCYYCPSSSNLFGCAGLPNAKFCVLNKQYSEADYKKLVDKIIAHMKGTGEWGEFFPASCAPVPYNLSHAHEYYPLTKAQALERGYGWREEPSTEFKPSSYQIPDSIGEVSDDILKAVLSCEVTGRNYKLQKQELVFYRKMNLPVPRLCPDERHTRRMKLRNGRTIYQRKCAGSGELILSTIPPDNPADVLCEEEFLKAID